MFPEAESICYAAESGFLITGKTGGETIGMMFD
jgi:hypothetical protein